MYVWIEGRGGSRANPRGSNEPLTWAKKKFYIKSF